MDENTLQDSETTEELSQPSESTGEVVEAGSTGQPEDLQAQEQTGNEQAGGEEAQSETLTPNAQKAINKQHYLYKEEERKRIALEQELKVLREKQQESQVTPEPVVPSRPDPLDDDYEAQLARREEALLAHAKWEVQRATEQQRAQELQQAAQVAQQKELQTRLSGFEKRAVEQGFKVEELDRAAGELTKYQLAPDLANFLIDDDMGPAVISHLAANPLELDKVAKMSAVQAALYVTNTVYPKAKKLLGKPSTGAPDPVTPMGGRGIPEKTRPLIAGAKFE